MPRRSISLRPALFVLFFTMGLFGAVALSEEPAGPRNFVQATPEREFAEDLPGAPAGAGLGAGNLDFVSKAVLGPTFHAAYNVAAKQVYISSQRVVSVYSALSPTHLLLLGRVVLPFSLYDGPILSLEYPGTGNYVFASVDSDGIFSIDISTPTQPRIADSFTGMGSGFMDVDGTVAYLATRPRDVVMVDVSDPENMTFLGEYTQTEGLTSGIYAANGFAYVVAQDGLFDPIGIWVIDATDPENPVRVNTLFSGWGDINGSPIGGDSNRMYYFTGSRMEVVDLSTPAAPAYLGTDISPLSPAIRIIVDGTDAYISTGTGFGIVDAADPSSLSLIGSTTDVPSFASVGGLAFGPDDLVYLGSGSAGILVSDVSTPSDPTIVGSPVLTPGNITDLSVSGDFAYYISSGVGVLAVDTSDVDRAEIVSLIESASGATTLHATGDRLYYADSALRIVDAADPSDLTELGNLPVTGVVAAIDTVGNLAYLARGDDGLTVVDVADAALPSELGSAPATDQALDVKVLNGFAYVANDDDGLAVFDVSDSANPVQVGSLDTPGRASAVDVVGSYAYVADGSPGLLLVIDVSVPATPILVGQFALPPSGQATVLDVVVIGDLAYIACRREGVRVIDVSTPFAPIEVGSYATDDFFTGVAYRGGYVLSAEGDGGSTVLHYFDACIDDFEPNDDFATAFPIEEGTIYSPKICDQNDLDFFSITPLAGDTLDITMQPPPGKDYNLFLFDSAEVLVAASVTSGDAVESITQTVLDTGPYFAQVAGNSGEFDSLLFYTLFYLATPCPAPTQEPYITQIELDELFNAVLFVQDPNQPETVTGYNLYRSNSPVGPFDLIGENLTDFDQGTPNVQLVDTDSGSCGPLCFYKVTALNGTCGAEGPGAPEPLPACPSVTPCNGQSCLKSGLPLSVADTGMNACLLDAGTALNCGVRTVHVATHDCVDAPCCFEEPACLCQVGGCGDGTYLVCD